MTTTHTPNISLLADTRILKTAFFDKSQSNVGGKLGALIVWSRAMA